MSSNVPTDTLSLQLDGQTKNLRTFPRLSQMAFQHPSDRDASNALRSIPLFPELFGTINGNYLDQRVRMEHLGYNLRLGPRQGAQLYAKFVAAAQILDLPQIPEFYINSIPSIDAYAAGVNKPLVVLSHGCLTLLNETELMAVIGHELGHVKCQHGFNLSLTNLLSAVGVSGISSMVPVVGGAAIYGIKAAMGHWSRMAEFSCDRAALLVTQDPQAVAGLLSKIAGFHKGVVPDFNMDGVYEQLAEYERYDENAVQSLVKMQKILLDSIGGGWTHPSHVLRIKRVLDWGVSDHYKDILAGQYIQNSAVPPPLITGGNTVKCPSCGTFMPKDARFCSKCGHQLG
jgi:Zn-dependent protease with chaperone function